jgi:hypothetical protein
VAQSGEGIMEAHSLDYFVQMVLELIEAAKEHAPTTAPAKG